MPKTLMTDYVKNSITESYHINRFNEDISNLLDLLIMAATSRPNNAVLVDTIDMMLSLWEQRLEKSGLKIEFFFTDDGITYELSGDDL